MFDRPGAGRLPGAAGGGVFIFGFAPGAALALLPERPGVDVVVVLLVVVLLPGLILLRHARREEPARGAAAVQ